MTKEYAFYPGCSSQLRNSAANYLTSVQSMCRSLDIRLTEVPDWNCCGASVSYAGSGEIARHAMNARNLALTETHLPGMDMVATCAACWLNSRETQHELENDHVLMRDTLAALKEAGLEYKGQVKARHMVEVLIEDIGYAGMAKPVVKPLEGVKVAGYVGCQTNRPFGVAGESFENPLYLDRMVEAMGGEAITAYDQKVTCCGGALAFSEPQKSQEKIRDIVQSAYDHGADVIATPCPLCQANVEIYQADINKACGTKYAMPVVYYAQLMTLAYGGNMKESGLDGQVIRSPKLEAIAATPAAKAAA
ncbi:MAG TPA: CoB--CoM heterodisulfide reductase iron-sulfur subunit B family protein [Usitatibacter sp.]|nr:CoB--CoM heterodisulfide reductase iron-sulfur subunit B family protein [Usitatibacter sp.]